jgi:hypothetical protein
MTGRLPMKAMSCHWCGKAVDLPQRGWKAPEPAYCTEHHLIAGRDPNMIVPAALEDAVTELDESVDHLPRWPWQALDDMAGLILPESVTYVAAFPGNGKTSFVAHVVDHWLRVQNLRVLHMPLEASPREWLTRLLCLELGITPDEVLSRRLKRRADAGDRYAKDACDELRARYHAVLADPGHYANMIVEPADVLSVPRFRDSLEAGAAAGVDVIVVDHVDHVGNDEEDDRNEMQKSTSIQHAAKSFARRHKIPVVLMTQLNSKATGGDALYHYRAPRTEWLWYKGIKEQIGYTILGLFRPMKPDLDPQVVTAMKQGGNLVDIAEPNTMGVAKVKSRYGGETRDTVVKLHYEHGLLTDKLPAEKLADQQAVHGISTRPPGAPQWWDDAA